MAQFVFQDPAPILSPIPSGSSAHKRLTVTNASQTLTTILGTPIPSIVIGGAAQTPFAIGLAVENADLVRVAVDGQTTPTATLGVRVPQEPSVLILPIPSLLAGAGPALIAGVASTSVQCTFYWKG